MSMDLLLADDATPLTWDAPTPGRGAHLARHDGGQRAARISGRHGWGALDVLLVDLPPGTDRLATIVGLVPALAGTVDRDDSLGRLAAWSSGSRSPSPGSLGARCWA